MRTQHLRLQAASCLVIQAGLAWYLQPRASPKCWFAHLKLIWFGFWFCCCCCFRNNLPYCLLKERGLIFVVLFLYFSRQHFFVWPWLPWKSVCRPGWPRTHRDPPSSAYHPPPSSIFNCFPQFAVLSFPSGVLNCLFQMFLLGFSASYIHVSVVWPPRK